MLVGGEWVESESGARLEATSPATGEAIGTVPGGSREDARRAIAASNASWREWAATSAFERAESRGNHWRADHPDPDPALRVRLVHSRP